MIAFVLPILVIVSLPFSLGECLDTPSRSSSIDESGFSERWKEFHGDTRSFPLWRANWKNEDLNTRFSQLHQERWSVYFINPEECQKPGGIGIYKEQFQTPKGWEKWGSRYPYPGAFSYNLALPSYNASVVILHGQKFLALEAPTKENVSCFFEVLAQWGVTDLVRLTPAVYDNKENSFPYWEGHVHVNKKNGRSTIKVDNREMNYFFTDCWEDHEGIDPERLIALVKAVMENESKNQMIAVHCRAGVGRTGTFLAAYALIRDIDEQMARGIGIDEISVSIDKVIWQLSLQRPFMVARFSQYRSLYVLVDSYVFMRKNSQ